MDTVSQNSVSYSLNKDINGEIILRDIQKLIQKNVKLNNEYILTISIKPISYTTNELIPRLEYINLE